MAQAAATDSPQIVISYHADDAKWLDRLFTHLDPAVQKFGLFEDRLEPRQSAYREGEVVRYFSSAKVLVLLISRKYMAATWLKTPSGRELMEYMSGNGTSVMALILEDVAHGDFQLLRSFQISATHMTPLAAVSIERQDSILFQLAQEVVRVLEHGPAEQEPHSPTDQPTIDALSGFAKSGQVNDVLERARKLAGSASHAVTTPALLFALAEGGRVDKEFFGASRFLWDELTARGETQYTRLLVEEFPPLISLGERAGRNIDSIPRSTHLVSPNVIKVFRLAETIASVTSQPALARTKTGQGSAPIEARHLLGALLVSNLNDGPTGAQQRLASLVGDLAALRKRFYDFLVASAPDDNLSLWQPILIRGPESIPSEEPDSQRPEPIKQPSVAGFMADDWHGRDLLGIERDVNALASLVAAYKVEPPLSIGLFGDWGSGKSHFMRQMRKRVELLSQKARESGKPQNELGYYKNIVQIEFNAWHYIEGNLWASLVDHIFANLRLSEKEPRSFAEERRDELMQKLGVKEEFHDKINSKVQECEEELRRLNERKERAEAELEQASTQLNGFREEVKASLKTLSVRVSFTEEEKELLGRLGIDTGSAITGADVHRNYLALKNHWNGLKAKWKLFRTDKRVWRRYLLSALLVLIVIGAPALLKLGAVPRLPTVVVSILGFVATLVAAAKPAWEQFHVSLKALEKHELKVERERQKRITELENEVSALTKEVVAAKLEGETVGKEIEKLKIDIATTSSSRILAEFIEDRAAASDYRRHLGLLALIRRDFEKLRDLFDQQRNEESKGNEVSDDKKINRIILYIDDLDRCPPDRVVQVLQAIHLLLAFPLFVVVVGVDSRWITRSLQQSYEWLREVDEQTSNGDQQNGTGERDDHRGLKSGATPHDYLEKIFQIPFWLRPMNHDACVEFLDGLTKEVTDEQPPAQEKTAAGTQPWSPATLQAHSAAASTVQPPPEKSDSNPALDNLAVHLVTRPFLAPAPRESAASIDLAPRSLTFSAYEVDYMKKLVPLIGRSPRAVKRFLNCYRLIKVGLTPTEFDEFIGEKGESLSYKAVMVLLGVITGTPTVSAFVIEELKSWQQREFNLESFVRVLSANIELRQKPDAERFLRFLESHDFGKTLNLLFQEVVTYGPRVSRFSFRVSRAEAAQ